MSKIYTGMKEILYKSKHTTVVKEENGHEMIQRPVASAVLALYGNSLAVMVLQERGSFGKILEVPAGKVDKGEESIDAGARELKEETGYVGESIELLGTYYPSVGYSTEEIHCFLVKNAKCEFGQKLDDGERISISTLTLDQLKSMIRIGTIKDSKTIMCLNFFKMRYPDGL